MERKLIVTCKCGEPITKSMAARVLREGRKEPDREKLRAAGKKGALKRWKK